MFQRYCREVLACSQLSHPNVVPFVGIISTPSHPFSLIFDTAGHLGLIEYLEKNPQADKMSLVRRTNVYRSAFGCNLIDLPFQPQVRGIARGLRHVHDLDIIHGRLCSVRPPLTSRFQNLRRLTPSQQNILVSPDGTPRITGFGSSLVISRPELLSDKDVVGFHRGSAPELMRSPRPGKPATQITKESDMYAFGMLAWEVGTFFRRNLRSRLA